MTALIGLAVCALWLWIYRIARRDNGWAPLPDDASSQTRQDKLDAITRAHLDDTYLPDDEPPTHDGPCTRSYDPDGKPLHYCAVCFQDMPAANSSYASFEGDRDE